MKSKIIYRVLMLLALISITIGSSEAKKYQLNKNVGAPFIGFLSKAPMEDIKGSVKADKISSNLNFDLGNIEATNGNISLEVKAMETGLTKRDEHMYNKEWLDAAKYPTITFDLKKITKAKSEDKGGKITIKGFAEGNITIHGKSKSISSPISITFLKESASTKQRASGDLFFAEGKFDVELKDFDIKGIQGVVGSKVGEVINIDYKLFYNSTN